MHAKPATIHRGPVSLDVLVHMVPSSRRSVRVSDTHTLYSGSPYASFIATLARSRAAATESYLVQQVDARSNYDDSVWRTVFDNGGEAAIRITASLLTHEITNASSSTFKICRKHRTNGTRLAGSCQPRDVHVLVLPNCS